MVFSAVSVLFPLLLHPGGILNTAVNNGSFEEAWDTIAKMEACLKKALGLPDTVTGFVLV